jgi:hypothetical protein
MKGQSLLVVLPMLVIGLLCHQSPPPSLLQ